MCVVEPWEERMAPPRRESTNVDLVSWAAVAAAAADVGCEGLLLLLLSRLLFTAAAARDLFNDVCLGIFLRRRPVVDDRPP